MFKLETATDIRPSNLGSRAKEKKKKERGQDLASYPRAHFYEILKPLNECTAQVKSENGRKKCALGFQILQGNRLTPEIDCDDSAGRGGSRDFSQGLNRAWPPERSSVFFLFISCPSSRSRAGTWPATCTRPSREARKNGKRNIAEEGRVKITREEKTGDYARSLEWGKKYTREKIPRAPFPILFLSRRRLRTLRFPSLWHPLARPRG